MFLEIVRTQVAKGRLLFEAHERLKHQSSPTSVRMQIAHGGKMRVEGRYANSSGGFIRELTLVELGNGTIVHFPLLGRPYKKSSEEKVWLRADEIKSYSGEIFHK